MATEKHDCSGKVVDGWSTYSCMKNGNHYEDGKWWCGVHAPSKEQARREKRDARYRAERDELDRLLRDAKARCVNLSTREIIARPAYDFRLSRYTGGVELDPEATDKLIELLRGN